MKNETVKCLAILVDPTLNSRHGMDDKETARVAASIKDHGLIHPPTVIAIPAAFKNGKDGAGKTHLLVAGFRRFAAVQKLGWLDIDVRVAEVTSMTDALLINTIENLGRKDITRYEVAKMLHKLNLKPHGLTHAQIADRLKGGIIEKGGDVPQLSLTEGSVGNYCRMITDLSPEILQQFALEHAKATVKNLMSIVAEKDHAKQNEQWSHLVAGTTAPKTTEPPKLGADGKPIAPPPVVKHERQTYDNIRLMVAKVKQSGNTPDWIKGAVMALNWASKKRASLPNLAVESDDDEGGED